MDDLRAPMSQLRNLGLDGAPSSVLAGIDGEGAPDSVGQISSVQPPSVQPPSVQPPSVQGSLGPSSMAGQTRGGQQRARTDGLVNEDTPLCKTFLGDAIDALLMHWCQTLTNVSTKPPVPPPSTLDHVKEVAEVCSKHFRDACVEVSAELTRIGVQWEIENPPEAFETEMTDLDGAIARQNKLIARVKKALKERADEYATLYPDAGKHYQT